MLGSSRSPGLTSQCRSKPMSWIRECLAFYTSSAQPRAGIQQKWCSRGRLALSKASLLG